MKKIIPALAMLLISAIVMSTASFAWFTQSQSVTAKGMMVTAQADSSLLIAYAENGNNPGEDSWGIEADAGMTTATKQNLVPTSISNILEAPEKQVWYTAQADTAGASTAKAGTADTATITNYFTNTSYIRRQFRLYDVGAANEGGADKLYISNISIGASNAQDTAYKALRVAIISNGVCYYVTGEGTRTSDDASYVASIAEGSIATTAATPAGESGATLAQDGTAYSFDFENANGDKPTTRDNAQVVEVYIWYEGQDPQCYSEDVLANEVTVSVGFSTIATTTLDLVVG